MRTQYGHTVQTVLDHHKVDRTYDVVHTCLLCATIVIAPDSASKRTYQQHFDMTCCTTQSTVLVGEWRITYHDGSFLTKTDITVEDLNWYELIAKEVIPA